MAIQGRELPVIVKNPTAENNWIDPKNNMNCFRLRGDVSGYRDYSMQVQMKKEKGEFAATDGRSPHGWRLAFDMNNSNPAKGGVRAGSDEVLWMEKNASRFGFTPYLATDRKRYFDDGANRYQENWHWNFNSNSNFSIR